ncbi:hypothetical protein HJG60_009828 [Phyllostomus discolor]|uniref:Uncharacterized protein n=1 Tax=Phyllostomus discolor TaxID=89673 RepID=A0A834ELD4_9CHIR|nr:hypothetical protein HJG60_009828 [Phyllostomus discolor]
MRYKELGHTDKTQTPGHNGSLCHDCSKQAGILKVIPFCLPLLSTQAGETSPQSCTPQRPPQTHISSHNPGSAPNPHRGPWPFGCRDSEKQNKREFLFLSFFIIERGEEGKREREEHQCERKILMGCLSHMLQLGTQLATWAHALTWNQT